MKTVDRMSLVLMLLVLPLRLWAADAPPPRGGYEETPNPARLFIDQWIPYPAPPTAYNLDFLRTADNETAELSLQDAILIGLKSNPGIEANHARLRPILMTTLMLIFGMLPIALVRANGRSGRRS